MPRCPRLLIDQGIYHVTARGNRRQPIFSRHEDHLSYLAVFESLQQQLGQECYGFTLMPNHVHLIVADPNKRLSKLMHDLHGWYARFYNEQYSQVGHLFQDRFYSRPCTSEQELLAWLRYVHRNASKAGLVKDPREYPWSSLKMFLQSKEPSIINRQAIFRLLGGDMRSAQRQILDHAVEQQSSRDGAMEELIWEGRTGIKTCEEVCVLFIQQFCQQHNRTNLDQLTKAERNACLQALHSTRLFSRPLLATFFGISPSGIGKILKKNGG